jgi:hypothetical protein
MKGMQNDSERSKKSYESLGGITRRTLVLAFGCLIAGNCAVLHAQSDTGPAVITHGPLSFEPLLDVELSYDDNIFRSAADEVDSWVMRLMPILNTEIDADGQVYTFTYDGDYGFYSNSSDDNYDDHDFYAGADLNLNYRNQLNLGASYIMGHEDRGTGITEGMDPNNPIVQSPVELDTAELEGEYTLGSTESTNRLVLAGRYTDIQYQNYPDLTRFLSRDGTRAGATYYYRVRPATSLLAEVIFYDVSYDLTRPGTASLDSKSIRYRVGTTWDITEQTSGTVKLGQVDRKFDDKAREDFSAFDWDVTIRWSPLSYSHIDLVTARPVQEAYGGGADFIDTELYAAHWTHGWTERLESRLGATYLKEVFEGSVRKQETYRYDMTLTHQWRRWLSFELGASFSDRDSNIDRLIFERTVFWLSASFSL